MPLVTLVPPLTHWEVKDNRKVRACTHLFGDAVDLAMPSGEKGACLHAPYAWDGTRR